MGRSVLGILLKRGIGLVLFLFLVLCVNIISALFSSRTLTLMARFLNDSIGLIVVLTILFLIAELFLLFRFPLNLPGPVFNAAGSVLVVMFLMRVFGYLDAIVGIRMFGWLEGFAPILYVLVPLIVLIVGYASFLKRPKKAKARVHRVRRK